MKTLKKTSFVALVGIVALLSNLNLPLLAQTADTYRIPPDGSILLNPVFAANPAAWQLVSNLLAAPQPALTVPVVSRTNNLTLGTYWALHGGAPLPFNPYPGLPVYRVSTNQFLIDDSSVDYAALDEEMQAENAMAGLTNSPISNPINTNGLYLQVPANSFAAPGYFNVNVMNTVNGQSYSVLTKPDLSLPSWTTVLTTNAIASVTPVQVPTSSTNLFVWARENDSTFCVNLSPVSQLVEDGDSVTFAVATGGNPNLTYQWVYNGNAITGATNRAYTINNVQDADAGGYAVIISDGTNALTTAAAQLTTDSASPFGYAQTTNAHLVPILGSRQNYTFKSGVTYFIASPTLFYGQTTIEGGAVIKPDWFSGGSVRIIGTLDCQTGPYDPAILTSVDDDSAGEMLGFSGQDGPPFTASNGVPYLDLTYAQSDAVSNLRFCFADWGVTTPVASRRLDVWDCQFVACNYGVVNLVAGVGAANSLHNVLFAGCGAAVGAASNSIAIAGEQVTADVGGFCAANAMPASIALTNSIYWGGALSASNLSTINVVQNPDDTNFASEGFGDYYLTANSPLRGAGTANISPRLQSELQRKTTSAPMPIAVNTTISGELTLSPQARRYTNGAPDLGYYYDALDYSVANLTVDGGDLTVLPGTAVAVRNDYIATNGTYTFEGFFVREGSLVISHGTPAKPNVFTAEKLVQEYPDAGFAAYRTNTGWRFGTVAFVTDSELDGLNTPAAVYDFRFTQFFLPASDYHFWSGYDEYERFEISPDSSMYLLLQDCQFHGGRINLGNPDFNTYGPSQVYSVGALIWNNNLFENVSINLDPTYYWYNGTVNCDLQLLAYNNLFKGGDWLRLEPFPASAGNWAFRDNLFDQVNFLQDTNQPLDFDHNGYWPLLAREFLYNGSAGELTAATGGVAGGSEVTLNDAPPYQAGVFGSFYLPDNTPLYNAGSRSPSDAGLFQYTTRLDQTKEGDESAGHLVNIGLHYVAASGTAPKDSDGDGIPDYIEDANGDGLVDFNAAVNANETDWQNPMTDGVTNDAYNVAYDDIDLSGNGLVGRIKRALGLSPLDASNPLVITPITTGEEPEIATFEVLISYDTLTSIGILHLIVDSGRSGSYQECDRATNGNCLLEWNTTFDSPGNHYVQLELTLEGKRGGGTAPDTRILSGSGMLGSLYSSNVCQFDPGDSEFTDGGATLYATTPIYPDADYAIELQTTTGQHIRTITNSTSNGIIDENWDLKDDNGNTITNDTINAVFRVALLDHGYGQLVNSIHRVPTTIWDDGNFTVAYAWDDPYQAQHSMHDAIEYGVVDPLISPPESGGGGSLNHYDSTFNAYTWSGDLNGNPGWLSSTNVVVALITNLADPDTKNFYFDGHGNIYSIGDSRSASDPNSITINADEIAKLLLNKIQKTSVIFHPYRFVFLNACDTAGAPFWAHAFGIRDRITDAAATRRGRAQAFVGWVNEARAPKTDADWNDEAETYAVFFGAWMSGWPLETCISTASTKNPPAPFDSYYLNWPLGKDWPWNEYALPFIYHPVPFRIKIYGYAGLTRSGFEHGFDNSPYYK